MIKNSKIAWLQGIVAFLLLLIIAGAIAWQAQPASPATKPVKVPVGVAQPRVVPDAYSLPFCELEDGSTQDLCLWDDETGDQIVNVGYGRWSYNLQTGQVVEYDSHK